MDATDTIALIAREQVIAYYLTMVVLFFEWLCDVGVLVAMGDWLLKTLMAINSRTTKRIWKNDYG